ncbi:MAG: ABC transporter ATP-binding protein [Treponema sp.]|jgi:ABC-type Fe3+/spermidine/putrescine transport system ATPase subunit|nr:ABC transporter ATP-binding protein [Treponema sp.]
MLKVKALKKTYGDFSVSLDLFVNPGKTLALVGPSGSGKTTALNLIAGLVEPESGLVSINGEDVTGLPAYRRNISVVFQDLALFPHLDVGANIAYGLYIKGVRRKERRRIIEETLDMVRLSGYASRRIDTLSGGERQRVAIARALASNPKALLLDEPFSSLDAPLRKSLRREFLEIRNTSNFSNSNASYGRDAPCIFVTHDQEEAVMLGDRVALMSDGRIIETGLGRDILLAPKTEIAARFFGAGQVLPCTIAGERKSGVEVSSPLGILTVPHGSEFDPHNSKIFIPEDAIFFEDSGRVGQKSFNALFTGSLFEGKSLILKLLLDTWENGQSPGEAAANSAEPIPFELNAGKRMNPPAPGSRIILWVDQSLLRFVR